MALCRLGIVPTRSKAQKLPSGTFVQNCADWNAKWLVTQMVSAVGARPYSAICCVRLYEVSPLTRMRNASGGLGRAGDAAEDGQEVFRAELDLKLVDMDAGAFQMGAFGSGGWMPRNRWFSRMMTAVRTPCSTSQSVTTLPMMELGGEVRKT